MDNKTLKSALGHVLSPAFCFFLISLSYKLAWTTISSLLSQVSQAIT